MVASVIELAGRGGTSRPVLPTGTTYGDFLLENAASCICAHFSQNSALAPAIAGKAGFPAGPTYGNFSNENRPVGISHHFPKKFPLHNLFNRPELLCS